MPNDTPAAQPLLTLILGLAAGPLLVNPIACMIGLACIFILRRSVLPLFAILGIALALHVQSRAARESDAFAHIDPETFTTIEVPLERDWAPRDDSFVLRASHFTANGIVFDTPVAVYARFAPREIAMEATLRGEGFLRLSERGEYSVSIKSPELLSYAGRLRWWQPAAWNRALANRLEAHADAHPEEVALAQALVLGRGERLTDDMRDSFRRGGTYHLLVFSGLQIALAAALLAMLLRWLHAPRASDWLLLAFAALAPLFIGPTASVSRASVGIGLYALARICKRPTSLENLWCVAALLRLIIEPRDLTDASFHLTYAGAGALLFIGKHFGSGRRWLAHAFAAEVAITPLTLFHFHQYALGGSLVTLLMSPLIFAMLIASMLACAWPCDAFFAAIAALHRLCTLLNLGGVSGFFAAPPVMAIVIGACASILAIGLCTGRRRAIAIVLAMLIPTSAAITRSLALRTTPNPRVTFLDVGQGDAIAIRNGATTILVDGGRERRVLPLLADRGITHIDVVVLTHAHPDHCDGLPPVVEQFDVGAVWISPRRFRGDCAARLLDACIERHVPIHLVRDAETHAIGAMRIEVALADQTFRRSPDNNASVVLRVDAGRRFLLTGDIEKEAELALADHDFRADVLKVAHHGSRSSTSAALLDAVLPRIAVISCGRRNLFGHPHASVLEALGERGIRAWRTDRSGSIDVDVRGGKLYVEGRFD